LGDDAILENYIQGWSSMSRGQWSPCGSGAAPDVGHLRLFKKVGESKGGLGCSLRPLQLLQGPRFAEDHVRDGRLDDRGDHGRMKWVGIALVIALFVLYNVICFAAAAYDQETGKKVSGRERWKRFLLIAWWPFISTL